MKLLKKFQSVITCKVRQSKQLISHDMKNNTFCYKYTFLIEICDVCKDDIIVLDKSISKELGGIGPVLLCYKVAASIHLIDPLTLLSHEFDEHVYWKYMFKSYIDRSCLVEFIVI